MSAFLFINQYYWPDEAATAQLLADLAEDLAAAGHQVTVLCGRSHYLTNSKLKLGRSEHERVHVIRVGGTNFGRFHWMGRILDMLSFFLFAALSFPKISKQDAVISMTSPPFLGRLAMRFKKKHARKMILWSQDIYPEIAERVGAVRNPFLLRYLYKNAKKMYASCDLIVVPGEDMKEILLRSTGLKSKVVCIPNWSDLEQILPIHHRENCLRKKSNWNTSSVLMYSGNIGVAHDTESMLELLLLLQRELASFHFVLVGTSKRHLEFEKKARASGLYRMSRLPSQPRSNLGKLLTAADAHLVSQKTEVSGLLVPSKFYGALGSGRPVIFIGPEDCEVAKLTQNAELGAVIVPGRVNDSLQVVLNNLTLIQRDESAAKRLRLWAEVNAARKRRTREFDEMLKKACES